MKSVPFFPNQDPQVDATDFRQPMIPWLSNSTHRGTDGFPGETHDGIGGHMVPEIFQVDRPSSCVYRIPAAADASLEEFGVWGARVG